MPGDRDLQVGVADAETLKRANTAAELAILPGVNHVLKDVGTGDRDANSASYASPGLPLAPRVVNAIARFLERQP